MASLTRYRNRIASLIASRVWAPQFVAVAFLLWALSPTNPYAYYVLLRWVCFGVFGFLTTLAVKNRLIGWAWGLGTITALYNPFFTAHLTRELWSLVNIATILVATGTVFSRRLSSVANSERRRTGA